MNDAQPEQPAVIGAGPETGIDAYLSAHDGDRDLKGRTVRSGVVSMIAQAIRVPVTFASLALLGRLLHPDDYGVIGTVTVLTNFVIMFQDMGLPMATIQRPTITHRQVSNLFWLNLAIGVVMTALLVAVSPLVAWFYDEPRARALTCVLGLAFLVAGAAVQHHALLRRRMRFKAIAVIDLTALLAGTCCGILLARNGAGYWALVAMQLTTTGVWAAGVWLACRWVPALPSRGAGIRPMLGFGRHLSGYEVVNYVMRNFDNLLIGRVWGTVALGFYSRAYNLFNLPLASAIVPFASVMIPALSRLQDQPQRFRNYYLQTLSAVHLLTMPLAVLLILFPTEIAVGVLGPQWHDAGAILQILAVSALLQPTYYCLGWLFIALGRTRRYFYWGLGVAVVTVAGFAVGVTFGPRGVATAYAAAMAVVIFPCIRAATRDTPVTFGDVIRAGAPHVVAALAAVGACVLAQQLRGGEAVSAPYRLALAVGSFVLAECVTIKLWAPPLLQAWHAMRDRAATPAEAGGGEAAA